MSKAPSALSAHVAATLDALEDGASEESKLYYALAAQVQHNLQYQHDWTACKIHKNAPSAAAEPFPRPMILGKPPYRLYIHPDEQIEHIKAGTREKDLPSEEVWVLPTRKVEKGWNLRKMAEVFDALPKTESASRAGRSERDVKRLLLATVEDDSTIVYYIVHDGIVKPRQN